MEYGRTAEPFEINALCTDVFDLDGFRRLAEAGVTELQVVPWYFTGKDPDDLQQPHRLVVVVGRRDHGEVLSREVVLGAPFLER